ncbi:MAG: autotransporter domain-containing protein [Planctomycetes bacterium]|nr:autotransporter domain-containing protein [Planctomycetota bacterium]
MQDGIAANSNFDVTATIDKRGTGTWNLGKTFTPTGNDDVDLTIHDGSFHLYRQGEVTGVTAGGIDLSGAAASSFNVTSDAILSIGGGNAIRGNATIAAKMVTFDMTGATTTDARLTLTGTVAFTPEAVNVTNTTGLGDSDYLLLQTETGTLTNFTGKLYRNGIEYVPERSSVANAKMFGLKTNNDGSQLSLGTADATLLSTVEWNPGATSVWDVATSSNWKGTVNGMSISTFLNGDTVNFSSANAGAVQVVASGVTVDAMNVEGDYSFSGGTITGTSTNTLAVRGGSTASFANQLNFGTINLDTATDTIAFAPEADWTLNGVITGLGNVVMDAAGKTMTLAGANTHTGSTTVKSGVLAIADASGLAASEKIVVDEDATLAFTANGTSAIKALEGAGSVEKRGTGDLSVESGDFSGVIDFNNSSSVFQKMSTGTFIFSGYGGGTFNHDAGTVALDGAHWNGGYNAVSGTRTHVLNESTINGNAVFTNAAVALGDTLNVAGSARLDGATLDLDLAAATGTLSAQGAVTLDNNNTLNITTWANGEYLVVDSGTGITDNGTLDFRVNGQAIASDRLTASAEYRSSNKQLYLVTEATNFAFTWTGATNNTWDYSAANWAATGTNDTTIIAGDKVIFEAATQGGISVAAGGVQVSEVSVTGDYTYTGGGIAVVGNDVGNGTFSIENGSSVAFQNGANTFENGISVGTDGKLAFGAANQLGAEALSFDSGDTTFTYSGTDAATVANDITLAGTTEIATGAAGLDLSGTVSGTGGIAVSNGTITLSGENAYAGGTTVENGSLAATNAKALGTGAATFTESSVKYGLSSADSAGDVAGLMARTALSMSDLLIESTDAVVLGENLSLNRADAASTVAMTGDFTLTDSAGIDAKSAEFVLNNGSSLTVTGGGTSTLASGATLFSGAVTVEGDSILAITGTAQFDTSSASLRLTAGSGQAPGQFHAVGGDIDLTGTDDLDFMVEGADADITGKTILVADNAADIIDRLGNHLLRLAIQNENEIFVEGLNSLEEVLEGMLETEQFAGNIGSGAGHFDTVLQDSTTLSALQATMMDAFQLVTAIENTDTMVNALRQTFGEYAVEAVEAPRLNLDRFQSQVAGRMSSQIAGTRIARALSAASGDAMASFASCTVPLANRIWGGGFGVWADQDTRDNVAGYKYRAGGFILGYERILDDRLTIGFAGAYTRGNTKSKGLATEYDSDNINLGLYASYTHESNFYARAGVDFGYSWNDYDVSLIAGGRKSGDFESQTYSARLELGYDWEPVCNTFITPYAGITYAHVKQDDWQETGTAGALTNWFDKSTMDIVDIPVGVRLTRVFPLGGGRYIAPEVHTAWVHSAGDKQATVNTGYNGSSIANALRGINPGRNRWQVGASVKARLTERFDASVDYTFQTRSGYTDHSVYLNMGVSF